MQADVNELIAEAYMIQLEEENKNIERKNFTFIATTFSRAEARRRAAEHPGGRVVQIDPESPRPMYGVIVPVK